MNEEKSVFKKEEVLPAEAESVEPAGGELTEDELDEAVGGVGTVDEPAPRGAAGGSSRGWWHDPND